MDETTHLDNNTEPFTVEECIQLSMEDYELIYNIYEFILDSKYLCNIKKD